MASITIELNDNSIVANEKKKHLQVLGNKLDIDVLNKLAELSENKKAIDTLKNPPALLKTVLGIK